MTALRVPETAEPRLSAVVIVHDAWDWTERCLGALVAATAVPYELVVVDNASGAETVSGLQRLEGAVVIRNHDNLGFGVAANIAVARCRAPFVLLLNSDALVEPGYDRALLDALDDPGVAAAAARLLHPDGRLQEAGCILWSDGRADNYGDRDIADRPEYRFRRDVDYASAACMLVRRRDHLAVGGFDPRYHPAYYEDVDLCLTWAARGRRVVYQPRATAVHKRWASSDMARARSLMARNQQLHLERWGPSLQGRPARPAIVDELQLLAMRDINCPERFLVVGEAVPAAGRLHEVLLALREAQPASRVTLLAVGVGDDATARERLEDAGVEVVDRVQSPGAWIRQRRHHYTVAILDGGLGDGLLADLAEAQPGALTLDLDALPAAIGSWARAGASSPG